MFRPARRRSILRILALAAATLACPHPLQADTVYVTSFTDGGLYKYDSANLAGSRQTLSVAGSMTKPSALAIGPDGNLYIGESGNAATIAPSIRKYDFSTSLLTTVTTFSLFDVFPASIAFKDGEMLVGRNPFFGNTGPIKKVTGWNGGPVSVGDYTIGDGLASSPGLAVAADGRLYVSDQTYNFGTSIATGPVKVFNSDGTFASVLISDGQSSLAGPTGLVISGSTLYTASIMNGHLLQTDLGTLTTGTFSTGVGTFEAGALALLSDGNLLVGSPSGSGNLYRISTNGTISETFATGLGQIGGVVAVPEPDLLAAGLGAAGCIAGWLRLRRRLSVTRR